MWLSHVEVDHGGGLRLRVPVRFSPETALCGNTHLVKAPGGERQEMRERGGGRGGGGVVDRKDVMTPAFCF